MSSSTPSTTSSASTAAEIEQFCKDTEDVILPESKAPGKSGRAIRLRSNYFKVAVAPNMKINHFNVAIQDVNATLGKESVKTRQEKFEFMNAFLAEKVPLIKDKVAYDGQASLYYMGTINLGTKNESKSEDGKTFKFEYAPRGRPRPFNVTIRKVGAFNSNDLNNYLSGHAGEYAREHVQAFDVILRHFASNSMILNGRNFYDPSQKGKDIGSGCEVYSGYSQACRIIQGSSGGNLAVNIDTAASAFLKQISPIQLTLEIIEPRGGDQELSRRNFWQDRVRKQIESRLKGIQFVATHLEKKSQQQKTWRCNSLSRFGAGNQQFELTDNAGRKFRTTVLDYYRKQYGISLKYPDAPCIVNGSEKNPDRVKYFPMELMRVAPRQAHRGKLDEKMTSNMIRAVATPAPQRQRNIQDVASKALKNSSSLATQYGMKISSDMEKVSGRVLETPKLDYRNQQNKDTSIQPRGGQWDIRDVKFFAAMELKKWIVINNGARTNERQIDEFANNLAKEAKSRGMAAEPPSRVQSIRTQADMSKTLENAKINGIKLVLIIMPRRSTAEYSYVKAQAEIHYGVMTQCILAKNVERANPQLLNQLLQKINTKLGGVNTKLNARSKVEIFKSPVMVVGLSISHASPGTDTPSIVSAAFSCDQFVSKFTCIRRTQPARLGIIQDLEGIMIEGLKAFYKRTKGAKPRKVVVYRNGGSEGEIQKIAKYEVGAVKNAFKIIGKNDNFNPGLTFLTVNKMHHTRLFAEDDRDKIGKSQNVPAGTIVDSNIVSRERHDFYLVSAQGIQGTSRPTHYTLIHDDNTLTADSLQIMTWHLCHGYARCTRSVSIPIPVYYAELDRERASRHLYETYGSDGGSMNGGYGGRGDANPDLQKKIQVDPILNDMYYV